MSPDLRAMLLAWLESGTEDQKRHARARLAMPDTPPQRPDPVSLAPVSSAIRAVKLGFRQCLYSTREGCGCSGTHCHHLGRVVTLPDCLKCLPQTERNAR